jgi:hypothetical protein
MFEPERASERAERSFNSKITFEFCESNKILRLSIFFSSALTTPPTYDEVKRFQERGIFSEWEMPQVTELS